jgi:hypothetical protein
MIKCAKLQLNDLQGLGSSVSVTNFNFLSSSFFIGCLFKDAAFPLLAIRLPVKEVHSIAKQDSLAKNAYCRSQNFP